MLAPQAQVAAAAEHCYPQFDVVGESEMTTSRTIAVIVLLAVLGIAFFLPIRDTFAHWAYYLRSLGRAGPIIMVLFYILGTVAFFPGSAMTLGVAGFFEPTTAFLIVFLGANGGAICAFLLARSFLRQTVSRWAENNSKFRLFDHAVGRSGFTMVLLARLSPIFPFNTLNYLLGITPVKSGAYIAGNLLGMLPGMILYVYIGAAAREALMGGTAEPPDLFQQALKYVGLLATIGVVFVIAHFARKALRESQYRRESALANGTALDSQQHRRTADKRS